MESKSNDDKQKRLKHKKRKRSSSSDTDFSITSIDEEIKNKLLKKLKKLKKKKKKKKKLRELEGRSKKEKGRFPDKSNVVREKTDSLEKSNIFSPMTKEEWERQQNTLRRIYDEETGRTRLIKGSGEIVEECVSRERQLVINKQATMKDGEYFQKMLKNLK